MTTATLTDAPQRRGGGRPPGASWERTYTDLIVDEVKVERALHPERYGCENAGRELNAAERVELVRTVRHRITPSRMAELMHTHPRVVLRIIELLDQDAPAGSTR